MRIHIRRSLLLPLLLSLLVWLPSSAASPNSITSPYTASSQFMSLVLDANGYPVVSYYSNGSLSLLHCNDANCALGGDSVTFPDTAGTVGQYTSLVLDANGYPVVSYFDNTNQDLKLLHCNDANCASGGDTITSPDTTGSVGFDTSLALDANGYPVVSYYSNGRLSLLHCNDANCALGGDSITSPDTAVAGGQHTSLVLDANGYPVVSYYINDSNGGLKLLHCNDANCAPGGDSVTRPDTTGGGSLYISLVLDANGYPVVSYFDVTNQDLKLLHCNDANCAPGADSITRPDTAGSVGRYTSLALDANGYPVVSYSDTTNGDLKLLHCNDANCAGGGDSITSPDTAGNVGRFTSLALDANGYPVVSYYDDTNGNLKLLHCGASDCQPDLPPTVTINQTTSQADPTSSSPIHFTVVFNELVTGFGDSAGDVLLSGTAGATTATVTGSGTTYDVAVSGMTGSGTVVAKIPANVASDAAGNGNQASTSTDNTVNFLAGTLINGSVTQTSVNAGTYDATLTPCGTAGSFATQLVTPALHNNTSTTYSGLYFKVKTLEYKVAQDGNVQPKLCNGDIPGGGVGATFTVTTTLAANSNLTPSPAFQIGLPVRVAYRFFVDLYAASATAASADGAAQTGAYLGSFAYEFDPNGQPVSGAIQIFLPLISNAEAGNLVSLSDTAAVIDTTVVTDTTIVNDAAGTESLPTPLDGETETVQQNQAFLPVISR